jgi:DNA-binding transcriptional LysR family regulator
MGDELPYLETFAEAAERCSFTAAAHALGLTQPAISQRIHELERILDAPLFLRKGGGVELTPAGRTLHGFARRIGQLHREAREAVTGEAHPEAGELSLAASSVPGEHLMPALLAAFRERHPLVRIRASVSDTRDVLDQVSKGKADLGLVGGRDATPGLEFRSVGSDRIVLLVPPTHPWAARKRIRLEELKGQPLVLREPGSGSRWCLEQALSASGSPLGELTVSMELGSNEAVKAAVRTGAGVAALSRQAAAREIDAGTLVPLDVAGMELRREICLVTPSGRALPPAARLFREFVTGGPG